MRTGVLGPLLLADNVVNLVPSAPKPRQLLAFLLLNANQVIRSSECITELWGSRPPKSAMSTLQTYVLAIRQSLRGASRVDHGAMLVTKNQGYQLTVNPAGFDRFSFGELARLGREAAAVRDDEAASRMFADALALWRGPALADVEVGLLSSAHLVELEESRKGVLEQRIEADLRLGRHYELLDELETLVASHPTHENTRAQYMLALYRSGERSRALAVFRMLRLLLKETLGIEPAPRLRRLYEAMRAGDRVLDPPATVASSVAGHAGSATAGLQRLHGR